MHQSAQIWKFTRQNDGCLNFVDENDEVLISGFGRRGKAKGDIPGVRFKVVKVSGVGLLALWKEKKVRGSRPVLPSWLLKCLFDLRRSPARNSSSCHSVAPFYLWYMPCLYCCNPMHFQMKHKPTHERHLSE